jgi:hypothetical protein
MRCAVIITAQAPRIVKQDCLILLLPYSVVV